MQHQPQSVFANGSNRCAYSSPAEILRAQVYSNSDLSFLMEAQRALRRDRRARSVQRTLGSGPCRLSALLAATTPTKPLGANSSMWSSAWRTRPNCPCSLDSMRACDRATRQACGRVIVEGSIADVEPHVAALGEIFEVLGYDETCPCRSAISAPSLTYGSSIDNNVHIPDRRPQRTAPTVGRHCNLEPTAGLSSQYCTYHQNATTALTRQI